MLIWDSTVNVTDYYCHNNQEFLPSNLDTDNADGNASGILFSIFLLYLTVSF